MVPKVTRRGTSFKGALAYYLHDKRQDGEAGRDTSERVEWSATRGFYKDDVDPELAGRIMMATALDQERLKREAGIKNTGQKSKGAVYAYSLAWHPDEAGKLTKAEMLRAADESLRAIGAGDRQAIIAAHNDEPHPHVHVIVNLVSPEDGRNLSVHADRNKLSAWALAYRKERGEEHLYCPARSEKAEAMKRTERGEKVAFVAGEKSRPRSAEKDFNAARAANDNRAKIERDRQAKLDAGLSLQGRSMRHRHGREWVDLADRYRFKKAEINKHAGDAIERAKAQVKEQYRPAWRDLYARQFREKQDFDAHEATIGGKIKNVMAAIKSRRVSEAEPEDKGWTAAAFNFLTSQKARAAALDKVHRSERRDMSVFEREELGKVIGGIKADRSALLSSARTTFGTDRAALIARQADDRKDLKLKWRQRGQERRRAFAAIPAEAELKRGAKARQRPRHAMKQEDNKAAHKAASEGRTRAPGRKRSRKRSKDEG